MATVNKKGNRWYVIFYDKETKKRPSVKLPLSIKTKKEARKIAAELEDERERKALGISTISEEASKKINFYDAAEPILDRVAKQQHSDTLWGWKSLLRAFLEICENRDISEYTAVDIEDYRDGRLSAGKSPTTVKTELSRINQIFKRGVNEGYIDKSPCEGVAKPKIRTLPPHWMERNQLASFFRHCPKRLRLRFMFVFWTGTRKKEALGVDWKDIDFKQKTVLIQNSKNPKQSYQADYRTIPLRPILVRILKTNFAEKKTGKIFRLKHNWRRDFLQICKKAGIEGFTQYDTRHTFASQLVRSEVPLTEVRDLLGHSTVKMTERYAHLAPENLQRAIEKIRTAPR